MTGRISSRPSHISAIMITVDRSLKGANEPNGPAKPKPGPTFPSVVAAARDRVERDQVSAGRAASIASTSAPTAKMPT